MALWQNKRGDGIDEDLRTVLRMAGMMIEVMGMGSKEESKRKEIFLTNSPKPCECSFLVGVVH